MLLTPTVSLLSSRPVQPTSSSTSAKTRSGSPLCRPPTQAPPPQPSWPMTSPPAETGTQTQVRRRPTSPWKRTELVSLWVGTRLLLPLWRSVLVGANAAPCWSTRVSAGQKTLPCICFASVRPDVSKHQLVSMEFFSGWRLVLPEFQGRGLSD